MRTIITDRYATKVWLPCVLGVLGIADWHLDGSESKRKLVFALIWFAIAGAAFWERLRKSHHVR